MSFTIWHTKADGTLKPIRMSILDAFRGVPDPKPKKSVVCPCCGKAHNPRPDKKHGSKAEERTDAEKADDETILRMKEENHQAQWKDILEQTTTFKDQHQVKARYKELIGHKQDEGKDDSNDGSKGKKKDKDAKNREEGLKRAKGGQGQQSEASEKKKGKGKQDKSDSNVVKAWAESYDNKKWLTLASKHYDKTGQRITPEQARQMAEGK
ncbi:hypothetical protein H2202_009123 [Exophiala xenobiotica]|nr:hypothetical protein H2202_009123 [Exophiala xenobiotica]KAK5212980.1 hypothetical protein LTR41_001928 [Exophiala xenobiotica]KAK5222161.1 hypothetical protein LTR72_006418 [Exophiala xenobiotica]KAK5231937.1 hypothetical protein LTR47_007070 [Exophiala xenobiotica]KAK5252878.1 hypothetical protein LTS06_002590 [Exophiala xenobiotica]